MAKQKSSTGKSAPVKAAKPSKSKDGFTGYKALGSLVVLVVAVVVGWASMQTSKPQEVLRPFDVEFSNPHSKSVYLFEKGKEETMIAELSPRDSKIVSTTSGKEYFFSTSSSGTERQQFVTIEANWNKYAFNAKCKDALEQKQCAKFKRSGACKTHPGYMSTQCAATCNVCYLLDQKTRCNFQRLNMSEQPHVGPGEIELMLRSLESRFPEYNAKIISREPDGPWIATLDNFVSEKEASILISTTKAGMRRSTDQGAFDEETGVQTQVTSLSRTSSNSWCGPGCEDHPVVQGLIRRISKVVGVPEDNFESPQILQYDRNQYYNEHHDSNAEDWKSLAGPRLYTFFLYFDEVEEGGETSFPKLNLTVRPAKGKALLWPSMKNDDPYQLDMRTRHTALPVIRGIKRSANVWVHQRNFKIPNVWACSGAIEGVAGENR
eukprot:TRINITY_DN30648_c0_g1_i1.p1 TRINITY_DN30648_c0_g1~~TRINITY_DN30648_c0_g1_i1.p1  ORF type:complete len:435 (+),score=56.07 TRINITY_DN30648_c0_g1_i1:73-1377(+)